MNYWKLLARGSKRHLMKPGQLEGGTTLCGCVVTGGYGWLRISALEGDECEECAALSFQAPSQASNLSSGGVGEEDGAEPPPNLHYEAAIEPLNPIVRFALLGSV